MGYYERHIFFCVNDRGPDSDRPYCNQCGSAGLREYAKKRIKALGLSGEGKLRINGMSVRSNSGGSDESFDVDALITSAGWTPSLHLYSQSRGKPQWHEDIFNKMPNLELIILIGMYAQNYYLKKEAKRTLTETVANYKDYLPKYFVLPHPSPRNRFWLTKNPWFDDEVLPILKNKIQEILS